MFLNIYSSTSFFLLYFGWYSFNRTEVILGYIHLKIFDFPKTKHKKEERKKEHCFITNFIVVITFKIGFEVFTKKILEAATFKTVILTHVKFI